MMAGEINGKETVQCVRSVKNNECDVLVGELLLYGSAGMICLLELLCNVRI